MQLVCFEQRRGPPTPRGRGAPAWEVGGASPARGSCWATARRLGALLPDGPRAGDVVDLNTAFAVQLSLRDAGAPEAEADSLLPSDPLRFLQRLDDTLPYALGVLDFVRCGIGRWDAPDFARSGALHARRDVRLVSPVPRPGKIIGVACNYGAASGGPKAAPEPVLFLKASSCVVGPEDDVVIPEACAEIDCGGTLAVVIGRRVRRVGAAGALGCVAGYTVANDVSACDFLERRGQRFIGTSCDTFAPLGPALVTADEIADPQDLAISTRLSGRAMQAARTKEMTFPVAEILARASRLMTLEPGDVVLTGTPSGVGRDGTPPRWLRDGDVVEIEIGRVGRLHNYVRQEKD